MGMSAAYQKAEWQSILDQHQRMGLNAIVVQIRPSGDALYPSKLVPWTEYLTGRQGASPNYNPLQFMIEEAHKRNMEFHAWMNPYRLSMDLDKSKLASNHLLKQHPDWCIEYSGRYYLNPALPQVRQHLGEVVGEVVKNYDVDAIHFDDYFYPYKENGVDFPDQAAYKRFGARFANIADWRRNNVDLLIAQLSKQIKALKPHVKFGISPFGVWRNKSNDPIKGSDTKAGHTSYDDLYADILSWLDKGWIDYVAPQLYWSIGFAAADYEKLLDWWRFKTAGKHLYIGHSVYKVNDNFDPNWAEPDQIPKQIRMSRKSVMSKGSIHFSSKPLLKNPLGLADSLSRNYYKHPTLLPEMIYLNIRQPKTPDLKKIKAKGNSVQLSWKYKVKRNEPLPYYFVVYRVDGKRKPNSKNGKDILATTPFGKTHKKMLFEDLTTYDNRTYTYMVTAVNRQHSESGLSKVISVQLKNGKAKKVR